MRWETEVGGGETQSHILETLWDPLRSWSLTVLIIYTSKRYMNWVYTMNYSIDYPGYTGYIGYTMGGLSIFKLTIRSPRRQRPSSLSDQEMRIQWCTWYGDIVSLHIKEQERAGNLKQCKNRPLKDMDKLCTIWSPMSLAYRERVSWQEWPAACRTCIVQF